jgi:N6-L-threonylcarbamoyladenine synthase
MKILGIETSCDETAAAILDNSKILSSVVASSAKMHAKTGGIIPEQAAREQIKSIIPVINEAFKEAHLTYKDIDAIAITVGPGLIGSLLVGVETAKTLGVVWNKPVIPINHLVAHIYANFIQTTPEFPLIALVVSGGHTDLVFMSDHGKMEWIAGTRDDAAGEAFDKCARILGLGHPGGPAISAEAEKYKTRNPKHAKLDLFPRPLIKDGTLDWSFSGLKTAVLREVAEQTLDIESRAKYAAEVQEAIVDVLINKTLKAVEQYKPKSLLLAGGVSANSRLREKFASEMKSKNINAAFHVPPAHLCTDNAAAIAACAYFINPQTLVPWEKIIPQPELTIFSKTN